MFANCTNIMLFSIEIKFSSSRSSLDTATLDDFWDKGYFLSPAVHLMSSGISGIGHCPLSGRLYLAHR